ASVGGAETSWVGPTAGRTAASHAPARRAWFSPAWAPCLSSPNPTSRAPYLFSAVANVALMLIRQRGAEEKEPTGARRGARCNGISIERAPFRLSRSDALPGLCRRNNGAPRGRGY